MEPPESITGHPEHASGRTGTNEVDVFKECRAREGLCIAQRM